MWKNIKHWLSNEQVFVVALLIATSLVSFVLGQYSMVQDKTITQPAIVVEYGAFSADSTQAGLYNSTSLPELMEQTAQSAQVAGAGGDYVASRSGARYHHITCPGAKQIKEENKIFFVTPAAAEAAGYTKAANCQW